jgi:adenine specific DNA methylase Mod
MTCKYRKGDVIIQTIADISDVPGTLYLIHKVEYDLRCYYWIKYLNTARRGEKYSWEPQICDSITKLIPNHKLVRLFYL